MMERTDRCEGAGGDPLVRRRFEVGRAAWPDVVLSVEVFAGYLARHAASEPLPGEEFVADMYLAYACADGVRSALAHLESILVGDVARSVASIDPSQAFVEDVLQGTRERLLVREGEKTARIADYGGRGSLRSWLCVVAVRCAISQRRRKMDRQRWSFSSRDDRRLAKGGPEFDYLRGRYKLVFEEAVRSAVETLPPKQRMLLRLNIVDGMSIDKLGQMYRVGRSTAARWLASARHALLEQARHELQRRLRITSTELESLGADLRSQLEVSLTRLLGR